jgi:hypothetical protein
MRITMVSVKMRITMVSVKMRITMKIRLLSVDRCEVTVLEAILTIQLREFAYICGGKSACHRPHTYFHSWVIHFSALRTVRGKSVAYLI